VIKKYYKSLKLSLGLLLLLSILFVMPAYRKRQLFEKVFVAYEEKLNYTHESNPNIMILFSGTPGMGKTVIAKRLEEKFHAVRLSTDDIRPILREHGLHEDLANKYLEKCAHKLFQTASNHLFVFDKSIDRVFNIYSKFAYDHQYIIFLIQLQVSRSIAEKRIQSRGRDVETILSQMDFAWKNYEDFGRLHKVDFVFENNENMESSLEFLIQKIDALIKSKQ
jgi:deoxyadenosine/deoxycytidine kinase